MAAQNAESLVRPPGLIALWYGVLAGPLVMAAEQEADFALVHWACLNDAVWVLRLIDLVALILVAAAALVAWRCWTQAGRENPDDAGGIPAATRFMALGGVGLSAMFFLAILSHGISMFLIGVCQ
jgi:hypothetical protein